MSGFPDVEDALATLLGSIAGNPDNTGSETPTDLQARLAVPSAVFIRVNRVGGGDDGVTDYPTVDVDVFAARRSRAVTVAEEIRQFLTAGPHYTDGALLDRVRTQTGPVERPWGDPKVRRWGATYTAESRRRRTT